MDQPRRTILAHLARTFAVQTENLATEGLLFILTNSRAARNALSAVAFPEMADVDRESLDLTFQSQVFGDDNSRPDLIGKDADGLEVLIVEAKFWEGLTEHQPVSYLHRLPRDGASCLLFVAPQLRFETLWPELQARCERAGHSVAQVSSTDRSRHGQLGSGRSVRLVSWHSVLAALGAKVQASGDHAMAADIRQLEALCAAEDTDAFLPIRSEELAAVSPQRLKQFIQLVGALQERLVGTGLASKQGLRQASKQFEQGHYLKLGWCCAFLHMDLIKWSTLRSTPLWIRLHGSDWKGSARQVRDRLVDLEREIPSRLLRDSGDARDMVVVPLHLRHNCEYEVVLDDLLEQVKRLHVLLGEQPD